MRELKSEHKKKLSDKAIKRWEAEEYRVNFAKTIAARYPDGKRTCAKCKEEKTLEEFTTDRSRSMGSGKCVPCNRKDAMKYKIKKMYGIEWEEFEQLIEKAQSRCEICKADLALGVKGLAPHIDHDHNTGRIRGILCGLCNRGIGQLGDDLERVEAAASYLRERR